LSGIALPPKICAVRSTPPPARPQRRNRSQQRERLLELLRGTDGHPTAGSLHTALRAEFPRLSLGTVYRNLDVLISQGDVAEIPDTDGIRRFDGNTAPHHHFVCDRCGSIQDLDLPLPRGLFTRLRRKRGLLPRQLRIRCQGLCQECSALESKTH
jgi:Fe2+ or Zn2+ uptake regulation protein